MDSAARGTGRGLLEGLFRVIMRWNSVYVTFIIAGAFVGERAVDYGVHKLWEYTNVGKWYEIFRFGGKDNQKSDILPEDLVICCHEQLII